MLNVNFLDEEDRRTSGGLWIEFVSRYRLTAPEVIDAYYKALQRELLNDKGEPVKLFPNLSLITAGEVMDGFIKYKRSSVAYEEGKKRLKLALNPKIEKEETEEEREARIKETIKEIKTEIQNGSYYDGAFVIYNDLRKSGVLSEFIPQPEEIKALQQKLMLQFLAKEKKRRFLLDVNTIKKLNKLADLDKPLPVHHLINLDIKSQIVHNYVKKNFLNRK